MTTAASTRTSGFIAKFQVEPVFGKDIGPTGWYIGCADGCGVWTADPGKPHLRFATREDCERAIQSLHEAGVWTDDDLEQLPDFDFRRIACQDLAW